MNTKLLGLFLMSFPAWANNSHTHFSYTLGSTPSASSSSTPGAGSGSYQPHPLQTIGQHGPSPHAHEMRALEQSIQNHERQAEFYRQQADQAQALIDLLDARRAERLAQTPTPSSISSPPGDTLQQYLSNPPVSEIIQTAKRNVLRKEIAKTDAVLQNDLKSFPTETLSAEIHSWDIYSGEKIKALELVQHYGVHSNRLQESRSRLSALDYSYSEAIVNGGLNSVSLTAQIAGDHAKGNFHEEFEISQATLEFGKAFLDLALTVTPGVSLSKDLYEAFTGKSLIDGSTLDLPSRSLALVGALTLGGSDMIPGAFKIVRYVGKAAKRLNLAARDYKTVVREVEAAGPAANNRQTFQEHLKAHEPIESATLGSRHGPLNPGKLHNIPAGGEPVLENGINSAGNTFRSASYNTRITKTPLSLYRVERMEVRLDPKSGLPLQETLPSYYTTIRPEGQLQSRIDSALRSDWGIREYVTHIEVPAEQVIHEGFAGSQELFPELFVGERLIGGGPQVFIERVPREWFRGSWRLGK